MVIVEVFRQGDTPELVATVRATPAGVYVDGEPNVIPLCHRFNAMSPIKHPEAWARAFAHEYRSPELQALIVCDDGSQTVVPVDRQRRLNITRTRLNRLFRK